MEYIGYLRRPDEWDEQNEKRSRDPAVLDKNSLYWDGVIESDVDDQIRMCWESATYSQ